MTKYQALHFADKQYPHVKSPYKCDVVYGSETTYGLDEIFTQAGEVFTQISTLISYTPKHNNAFTLFYIR